MNQTLEPRIVVELQHKMDKLKQEERQLTEEISQLSLHPEINEMQILRTTKRCLLVKDQIQKINALLVPDIIA